MRLRVADALSAAHPAMHRPPSLLRDADRGGDGSGADHRQDETERADRYLEGLIKEVGQPSPKAVTEAEALWDSIERARTAQAVG